jgi:hypothetical protein
MNKNNGKTENHHCHGHQFKLIFPTIVIVTNKN